MTKVLNFGSLNYDYVYQVDHIMLPGETQTSKGRETFCGGKGLNQSVALAKAGVEVYHAGSIGEDGKALRDCMKENGVKDDLVRTIPGASGHTVIQIDRKAENCILLYPGTNRMQDGKFVDQVLEGFGKGDYLLLQNEINELPYIVDQAYEKGMTVVLNPSPFDDYLKDCDLGKIGIFIMNELEGEAITGEKEAEKILDRMEQNYPNAEVVLTLGKEGAVYLTKGQRYTQGIFAVKAVDTTAAGDTFTGYFIAGKINGLSPSDNLRRCAKASSITVSRNGAAPSIPTREEVEKELL